MQRIYFDESGQTGAHLLDAAQPYFTIGSTDIGEAEAATIIARIFPNQKGPELKSSSVLKLTRGQRKFIEFAKEIGRRPQQFCAVKIDKRFVVISKMVDNLVEPLLSAQGYDFYKGDYARKFANSSYFVFDHLLESSIANDLMMRYNAFARAPGGQLLRDLQSALTSAMATAPHGSELTLGMMSAGAEHFDKFHDLTKFEDTNDIHVTAVVDCMGHWQGLHPGPFEVVHDESKHFFARSRRWEMITNPDLDPMVMEVGDKTLRLPIPVVSTVGAKSHLNASLQLCDLVAGFVSRASAPNLSDDFRAFVHEAIDAGFGQVKVFPIGPDSEFVAGPPEMATGADVVDQIAMAVAKPRSGSTPDESSPEA